MRKNILVISILVLFFVVTLIHSCSSNAQKQDFREKAGIRLLSAIYKEKLSSKIIKMETFKYYKIDILLSGDKEQYTELVKNNGYVAISNGYFCNDRNLIKIYDSNEGVWLKYNYSDDHCLNVN